MKATKAAEQSQDSGRQDSGRQTTTLDDRYGKIGILAVVAALRHQGELRNPREAHASTLDTAAA